MNPGRVFVAEAIGTFTLIYVGVLSMLAAGVGSLGMVPDLVMVALAYGLAMFIMVAAFSGISGGHFNPATTFGFVVTGRMSIPRGALYWAAQLVGAVLAAALIRATFGHRPITIGTPRIATGIPVASALVCEAVATFFLVLVVFATAVDRRAPRSVYPLATGMTVTMGLLSIGPWTGGALNPARSFGPALIAGAWQHEWVYWVGPLVGGALAAWLAHGVILVKGTTPEMEAHGGPSPAEDRA